MFELAKHMDGFEKEALLAEMHGHTDVCGRLYKRVDFMAVARVINPELCKHAFVRRPCKRTLRYIPQEGTPISEKLANDGFVLGNIYHSVDFNGATYTIEETGTVVGMAYFEFVEVTQ